MGLAEREIEPICHWCGDEVSEAEWNRYVARVVEGKGGEGLLCLECRVERLEGKVFGEEGE